MACGMWLRAATWLFLSSACCLAIQQVAPAVAAWRGHREGLQAEPVSHDGKVHVAYAVDGNLGAQEGLFSSLNSLTRHLTDPANCVVHILVLEEKKPSVERAVECLKRQLGDVHAPEILLHEIRPMPEVMILYMNRFKGKERKDLISSANLSRLYLANYFPELSRILWIDCDTIVRHDVAELYNYPMTHVIAAAWNGQTLDAYVRDTAPTFDQKMLKHPHAKSFNAGVLLIHLDRWRKEGMTEALERWAAVLPKQNGEDELLLNLQLEGVRGIDLLPQKWNTHALGIITNLPKEWLDNGWILHWTGPRKPWLTNKNNYRYLYEPYDMHDACFADLSNRNAQAPREAPVGGGR